MENLKKPTCPKCKDYQNVVRTHSKVSGEIAESDYYYWCQVCKIEVDADSNLMTEFEEFIEMQGGVDPEEYQARILGKFPPEGTFAVQKYLGKTPVLEDPPAGTPPRKKSTGCLRLSFGGMTKHSPVDTTTERREPFIEEDADLIMKSVRNAYIVAPKTPENLHLMEIDCADRLVSRFNTVPWGFILNYVYEWCEKNGVPEEFGKK